MKHAHLLLGLTAFFLPIEHTFSQCVFPINSATTYYSTSGCAAPATGIQVGTNSKKLDAGQTFYFDAVVNNAGELNTICNGGTIIFTQNVTITSLTLSCDLIMIVNPGVTVNVNVGNLNITSNNLTFQINGNLVVAGSITADHRNNIVFNVNGGTLDVAGGVTGGNDYLFNVAANSVVNIGGSIEVGNKLDFHINENATVNTGGIVAGQNAMLEIDGLLDVNGTINMGNNAIVQGNGILVADGIVANGTGNNQALCGAQNVAPNDFCYLMFNVGSCTEPNSDLCQDIQNHFLPITLLYFNAVYAQERIQVNWGTASEENNDFFEIEQSVDGFYFEPVKRVPGGGTVAEARHYRETIEQNSADAARLYFRLKQTDFDGSVSYSKTVSIGGVSTSRNVRLYPNPTMSGAIFSVQLAGEIIRQLVVTDVAGRQVARRPFHDLSAGEAATFEVPIGWQGLFYITICTDRQTFMQKLWVAE